MFLTHIYNFKYVFNSTVIKLSWHVLCYLISKNLYSLQNVQPFIFQLICMQLCKCINCFLKPHNKQLNQYCLNFTFFFTQKKKFKKNGSVRVAGRVGLTCKKHGSSHGSSHESIRFCFGSKNRVWIRYFSGRVTKFCFAMIHTTTPLDRQKKKKITNFFFFF